VQNAADTTVYPPRLALNGTPHSGNNVSYTMSGLATYTYGNLMQVLVSITGDGTLSGGIPVPDGSGRTIPLDYDAVTALGLDLPLLFTATINAPSATTLPVPYPSAPPGITVYGSAVTIDLSAGTFGWITSTMSYVTQ